MWVGARKGRATETQTFVRSEDWDLPKPLGQLAASARCSMCVDDSFQLCAVAVHNVQGRPFMFVRKAMRYRPGALLNWS